MNILLNGTTAAPPVVPLTWWSDWPVQGATAAEIGDTSSGPPKWDVLLNIPNALVDVGPAPANFPMANALRIDYAGLAPVTSRNLIRTPGAWTVPAVGQSIYRRGLWNNQRPVAGGVTDHPVQAIDATVGTGCCAFAGELRFGVMTAGGTYPFEFATSGDGTPNACLHRWVAPANLTRGVSYMFEDSFTITAPGFATYRAFLYDLTQSATIPLYRWDVGPVIPGGMALAFNCSQGAHGNPPPTPHNLGQAVPPVICLPVTCAGDPCLGKLMVCQQGQGQGVGPANVFWGGFGVNESARGWCGPWTPTGH